ncbi:MAG: hypothetical protein AAGA24_00165 [Pseudomonadota bacterium]
MNADHTEVSANWAPRLQMTLEQARRRSSMVALFRMLFVAGAAISAGIMIGPIAASSMSASSNKIERVAAEEVVTMVNPRFTGRNVDGEAFVITAETARRRRSDSSVIDLMNPRLVDELGTQVVAPSGVFRQAANTLDLFEDVEVTDHEGYTFNTAAARVYVLEGRVEGFEPLSGDGPLGDVRADTYEILDEGDRVVLRGNVDMVLYPNGRDDQGSEEVE